MKKNILTFMLVIFCFSISVHAQENERDGLNRYKLDNSKIMGNPDVVFMGNSITEFWSVERPEFFMSKPWANRGISGQTTPQMLVRFRQDVINLNPRVVVILAGTNDIAGNTGETTIEAIANNIYSMCELALVNNIQVILCSVLPAGDYPWKPGLTPSQKIIQLNELLSNYAISKKIHYLDYHKNMSDEEGAMLAHLADDGVHPNGKGYEIMEELLESKLNQIPSK